MGLETSTTIAGLNALWPLGSDSKSQGDDHLRLIKSVLKTEFPGTGGAAFAKATAQPRSRVVNGAMQVSQENGNTASTTHGYFLADQFETGISTTGTVTTQRVQSVTPNGSKDRLRLTATVADTSLAVGENVYLLTRIEGSRVADFRYGSASAKQSILRFGWKSPAGTYSVAVGNAANNRSYIANFTISAGQANTDTEQILVLPGDTIGTWLTDTGVGFRLYFMIAAGTTYQGVAGWQAGVVLVTASNTNGLATAGNTFELFDVGLYLDPDATGVPPKWTMPDEAEELRACMRYWQKINTAFLCSNSTNGVGYYGTGKYTSQPRISPSLTGVSNAANGFPATAGSLTDLGDGYSEFRIANLTGNGAFFRSLVTANARM